MRTRLDNACVTGIAEARANDSAGLIYIGPLSDYSADEISNSAHHLAVYGDELYLLKSFGTLHAAAQGTLIGVVNKAVDLAMISLEQMLITPKKSSMIVPIPTAVVVLPARKWMQR